MSYPVDPERMRMLDHAARQPSLLTPERLQEKNT